MTCTTIPADAMSVESASQTQGLTAFLKGWWDAYTARRARRATVYLLQSLGDRTLQDIGIDRSEIESVVYGKSGDRQRRYEPHWE